MKTQWTANTLTKYVPLLIFLVTLITRFGRIAFAYDPTYSRFQAGDWTLYYLGAQSIRDFGNFTNSLFLIRPPLFPLMVWALGINGLAVLCANALLASFIPLLTYIAARQFNLTKNAALLAAAIAAIDPASIYHNVFLGAEALANFLLILSLVLLLKAVRVRTNAIWLWGAASGFALVLSAYARPASYLVWIPVALWLIFAFRHERVAWRAIGIFAAVCLAGVSLWMWHNSTTFGNSNFSTIGVFNLLYYRAAGVERVATNKDIDDVYTELATEVETRLGHDTSTVNSQTRYSHEAATAPVQAAMIATAIRIFAAHPLAYVATIPVGLFRMYGQTVPGRGFLSLIDTVWNLALVLLTSIGIWFSARSKHWMLFWCTVLLIAYYTVGTLVVQTSGMDTRMRTMLTPIMAVASVYALISLRNWREGANRKAQSMENRG